MQKYGTALNGIEQRFGVPATIVLAIWGRETDFGRYTLPYDAVRALAAECDLVLVVGSANSSNSRRLVEVAERSGCRGLLVENAIEIPPTALQSMRRVGVTAGASAPEELVQGVVEAIGGLGAVKVSEHQVVTENMHSKLPPEVRRQRSH